MIAASSSMQPVGRQHASAAGVEARIFLEHAHRSLDRVDRALALLEDRRARGERRARARRARIAPARDSVVRDAHRSGAAVNHQPPACLAHAARP